jgi:hypothetical protein
MKKPRKTTPARAPARPPIAAPSPPPLLGLREVQRLLLLGYDDADIHQSLVNDGLADVDDAELDAVRAALQPPKVFRPLDPKHAPSADYLTSLGLLEMVRETVEAKEARAVLRSRRVRELVEVAAFFPAPPREVQYLVQRLCHHAVSLEGLRLFYSAYFDGTSVSHSELRVLVERHVKAILLRGVREEDLPAAKRAVRQDVRLAALTLPSSLTGWAGVMALLGLEPRRQDLGVILSQLEQLTATRAVQAAHRNGRDDARRAEAYTRMLQQTQELKQQNTDPTTELLRGLRSVALRAEDRRLPSIAELAGGTMNFTADVSPPSLGVEDDDVVGSDAVPSTAAE